MSRRMAMIITDDRDDKVNSSNAQMTAVTVGLGGVIVELDLGPENLARLKADMEPWIRAGTPVDEHHAEEGLAERLNLSSVEIARRMRAFADASDGVLTYTRKDGAASNTLYTYPQPLRIAYSIESGIPLSLIPGGKKK
jgi:hypothetical protein